MSDNNLVGDDNDATATPAPTNGSSSESSDISIEKLNPEETDVAEDKPEEVTKVILEGLELNLPFSILYID